MPQYRDLFRWVACGYVLLGMGTGASHAASVSGDVQSNGAQSVFIDLTAGTNEQSRTDASASPGLLPHGEPVTTGPVRTRFVDLSNGASPPPPDQMDVAFPDDSHIVITADQLADPYEESNRDRFETHVTLHRNLIDPVEGAYISAVPKPMRAGLHNFLTNLETPSVFVNDVLQVEPGHATNTIARFVINSTIGIVGIFDVATRLGIRYRDDDFGQTLAAYGVGDTPYLLIPVIGPTNPRDLTGKVVDIGLNPLRYLTLPGGIVTSIGQTGLHEIDKRSEDVGELDALTRMSADPYAEERSEARARREAEIGTQ